MTQNQDNPHEETARKNARMGLIVLGAVFFMGGLSFAAVPLYDAFCRVTGFGGTTQVAVNLPETTSDRIVTIKFNASTARNMPWDFKPEMREIDVKLGERGLTAYTARNLATKTTSGTAIYNVTPLKAGKYFNKIQCFCFDEQSLGAKEEAHMPVMFFVDPALEDDPNMDDVSTITLSYTFFPAASKDLDDALEDFYNAE